MTKDIFLRGQKSGVLCSTKYAENQQVTRLIHNFVHSFYELCIISFIIPCYTLWKSLKIVYLCPSVRGLLPGYALQSTPDRDKTWEDNKKQG